MRPRCRQPLFWTRRRRLRATDRETSSERHEVGSAVCGAKKKNLFQREWRSVCRYTKERAMVPDAWRIWANKPKAVLTIMCVFRLSMNCRRNRKVHCLLLSLASLLRKCVVDHQVLNTSNLWCHQWRSFPSQVSVDTPGQVFVLPPRTTLLLSPCERSNKEF